ncbi:MAG: class I SAM-dependent methyltransferase [Smithellaceae bacterium]|jgi:SAM-dependent methyltransferase|nr:class I SAM-dependent methyltransferase [Smithellaceae bacterium]
MKRCLHCSQTFESRDWFCPDCGWRPEKSSLVPVFSPELARSSSGFKASYFAPLAARESDHFWFRARNALIVWALEKYGAGVSSFMEIGCGTGFVLQGIAGHFPHVRLFGSEIYPEGIAFAAERIAGAEFMQMDARNIPFAEEFDVVGAFDVIEHIDEDETVLKQIYSALKPHGLLLLTVPQHRWLWSAVDDHACHVRRYTARELHAKVTRAGFRIERSTSFIVSLLPPMLAYRLMQRGKGNTFNPHEGLNIHPVLNKFFEGCLRLELALIRGGVSFPVGGSRLVVAKKTDKTVSNI